MLNIGVARGTAMVLGDRSAMLVIRFCPNQIATARLSDAAGRRIRSEGAHGR